VFARQNRGSTGHVRGKSGQNRGQNGAFCEFSSVRHSLSGGKNAPKRPWRSPNAAATPKKTPQNPPAPPKKIFGIFSAVALPPSPPPRRTRACPSSAAPAHHRIPRVAGGGRYGRNSRVIIFFLPMVKSTQPAESIARSATGISSRVVSRILRHGLSLGSGRANSF